MVDDGRGRVVQRKKGLGWVGVEGGLTDEGSGEWIGRRARSWVAGRVEC